MTDSAIETLLQLAEQHLENRNISQAIRFFNLAENASFDADSCAAGRWACYMLLGDFDRAWRESDAISQRNKPDPHRFWDGQPFTGRRLLIRCLHGLGDTIQFLRYAPLLRKSVAFLAIETQPALKSLIACSDLADEVLTWGDPEPRWNQQIEVMELPRAFRTTLTTIPAHVPYLRADRYSRETYEQASQLQIGLVWASSSFDPKRSIPLSALYPLFSIPQIRFWSLQVGSEYAQALASPTALPKLCEEEWEVSAVARLLNRLDLIISVDTMMAHLAGAMALPVWVPLPYACDWRWMLDRADSPWYPTMQLFRQPKPGDWASVVQQLQVCLQTLITRRRFEAEG